MQHPPLECIPVPVGVMLQGASEAVLRRERQVRTLAHGWRRLRRRSGRGVAAPGSPLPASPGAGRAPHPSRLHTMGAPSQPDAPPTLPQVLPSPPRHLPIAPPLCEAQVPCSCMLRNGLQRDPARSHDKEAVQLLSRTGSSTPESDASVSNIWSLLVGGKAAWSLFQPTEPTVPQTFSEAERRWRCSWGQAGGGGGDGTGRAPGGGGRAPPEAAGGAADDRQAPPPRTPGSPGSPQEGAQGQAGERKECSAAGTPDARPNHQACTRPPTCTPPAAPAAQPPTAPCTPLCRRMLQGVALRG